MTITEDFIKKAKKAFHGTADVQIEGNKLVARNKFTKNLHVFANDKTHIPVGPSQMSDVGRWLAQS